MNHFSMATHLRTATDKLWFQARRQGEKGAGPADTHNGRISRSNVNASWRAGLDVQKCTWATKFARLVIHRQPLRR